MICESLLEYYNSERNVPLRGLFPNRGICSVRIWFMPLSSWTCSLRPRKSTQGYCSLPRMSWPGRRPWSRNFSTRWDRAPHLILCTERWAQGTSVLRLRWGFYRLGCSSGGFRPAGLPPFPPPTLSHAPASGSHLDKVMADLTSFLLLFYIL